MPVLQEGGLEIAGREGSMDADDQSAALAAGVGFEARRHGFRLTHDAPGGIQEFLTLDSQSRTAVGALEKRTAQRVFEIAQAATQR